MHREVIMPNLPNMGMISVLSKRYEDVLTDEFLQRWLYQLYNDHLIDPDYVFMSQEDRANLYESLIVYPGLLARAYREMSSPDTLDTYVNRTTSRLMSVVILPGLPENTVLVGNLVLHENPEREEGEINVKPSKPTLADLYPYYSARQLNGHWYPVASYDGTNWVSPFEETFAPIHATQAVEKEDVLQWVRNNGGRVFG